MKETLEKILRIESECEEIKKNSKHEAKKIKENAVAEGKEFLREKKRDAVKMAYDIADKANQSADRQFSRVQQEIGLEHKDLTAAAERNMKKAADFIVERIVDGL